MSDYIIIGGELYHYGIKGMKWGVRRFQNKDGSLTGRGKVRYGSTDSSAQKSSTTNSRDHSKSDKSELAIFATMAALHIIQANPVGLVGDVGRLARAGESAIKRRIYDKERASRETDKKTGLLLKDKETSEREDASRVNPSVRNFDGNTKNNCMLCTTAYDLRRRGYEVQANKASYGYTSDELKAWYPKAKVENVSVSPNAKGRFATADVSAAVKSQLTSQGNGARGNLMIRYKSTMGGHSVAYEVSNGSLRIIDAQIGKVYDNPDSFLKNISHQDIQYARLDNVSFNTRTIKEAVR